MIQHFEKKTSYSQYLKNLVPSILTMVFLSFYTTIDGFFVSQYSGSDALAGINIVVPITCITFGVAVMIATGSGAIIGKKLGQKKIKQASQIFSFMCIALMIFSICFTILGLVFLKPISVFLGSSERLMEHVLPYAFVVFIGTIPMVFKLFFEYLVRSEGHPKVGLAMSVTGLVLNVMLDYIFVGVLRMGTLGAACGTLISITVSALIGLIHFLKYGLIKFCRPKIDFIILFKVCTNGSSEMLTEFSTGVTTFIFNLMIIKYFGEDGVAAVTIIMYIYYFFISLYMGITVATAPVVSYNLGSKNFAKISKTLKYSFFTIGISSFAILGISWFGGQHIIHFFTKNKNVFDITWEGLKLFSPVFLFIGVNVFLSGYFTALGKGLISAIISSLRSLFFVILFIIVLPQFIGVAGVFLTMPFSEAITNLVSLYFYIKKGKVSNIKVILDLNPKTKSI